MQIDEDYEIKVPFKTTLMTVGDGYWSTAKRFVNITGLELNGYTTEYGELRVFFDTHTWMVGLFGLIYTDSNWITELKEQLETAGLAVNGIGYSEQGMQGDDYVSLDVDAAFIASFNKYLVDNGLN